MIVKLKKPLNKLKIGVLGARKHLFTEILDKNKIPYKEIPTIPKINKSYDIIFGSGVYQLLKEPYLSYPKYGIIFFHETPLPEGRGNCPLQWTVINKRSNLTITAFKAVEGMDAGEYVYQFNIEILPIDTITEINNKRNKGIQKCFNKLLEEMKQGYLIFRPQTGKGSISSKRTPEDSELPIDKTLKELWDYIRICDNEKFPAFFKLHGKKIKLKYEVVKD